MTKNIDEAMTEHFFTARTAPPANFSNPGQRSQLVVVLCNNLTLYQPTTVIFTPQMASLPDTFDTAHPVSEFLSSLLTSPTPIPISIATMLPSVDKWTEAPVS
jgi:hypothetical protein